MTIFIRAIEAEADAKPNMLQDAVRSLSNATATPSTYDVAIDAFSKVPKSPFAYWAGEAGFRCFQTTPRLETKGRHAAAGAQTRDNLRFVRAQWEVAIGDIAPVTAVRSPWAPLAKGGSHRRFYADVHLLARWADDGRELKAATSAWRASKGWGDYWRAAINSVEYYGRPGITWPVRSQKGFSARALGAGAIFGHKGPTVFIEGDTPTELASLLALMNSSSFFRLVSLQMAFGAYEVGVVQNTPLPAVGSELRDELASLASKAYQINCALDASNETARVFILPNLLFVRLVNRSRQSATEAADDLIAIQTKIDELSATAYGFAIESGLSPANVDLSSDGSGAASGEDEDADDELDESISGVDDEQSFASWLVGVSFGRFDPRLATGERAIPPEPKPFDPLPSHSPGMYPEGEEPTDLPDILVADEGHADDLAARAAAIAERVKVDAPENLRARLAKEFFPLHIKMYSKSRRKAPIYWQLATPSASYSVWLYIHAFTKDTLYTVQKDYVEPKLRHEDQALTSLIHDFGTSPTASQRKEIAAQEGLVEELRAFLDEVKRVAPLWNPNLDDGVIINFAPLWRLVPHHKPWQKELKATWDALCDGQYDWAHLAMHLWPERVVPRCAEDRSFAIAHGLEEVFWIEESDGKWKPRSKPTRPLDDLVKERTSPAVKAALKGLLEAPAPAAGGKPTPKKKAASGRRKTKEAET